MIGLQEIEALVVGVAVGFLFTRLGLPVPAPSALGGVLGIVGIYLGYKLASLL